MSTSTSRQAKRHGRWLDSISLYFLFSIQFFCPDDDLAKRLAAAESVAAAERSRANELQAHCTLLTENIKKVKSQVREVGKLMDLFSEKTQSLKIARSSIILCLAQGSSRLKGRLRCYAMS